MHLFYRFIRLCIRIAVKTFYHHRVYGQENLPDCGALIAANHASFLDPPLMSISTPCEVHFLARRSLFRRPLTRLFISSLNSHPVSGSAQDAALFKIVGTLLEAGEYVVLFPEGYRSADGTLQPIKSGAALLALRFHCPIVPVYIHGTYAIWPRQQRWPKWHGKTATVFGKPIDSSVYAGMEKKAAQEALSLEVGKAIAALQAWYVEHYPD